MTDYYKIIKILGYGGFGKVYEVQNLSTSEIFACKKLPKANLIDYEKFKNEIKIMSKADNPHIIKLYEIYESKRSFYLIMELCRGGELFDKIAKRIEEKKKYSEKDAAEIFQQIMSGIEYCHNQGICHRDIKPENILYLYDSNENNYPLKIIDFGLSKFFKKNKLTSRVGSLYYVAPEVLKQSYNEKCDVWSAGIILFLLLSGYYPFKDEGHKLYNNIISFNFNFDEKIWKNISKEAQDLIKHILVPENERYSAKEVLAHPWFKIVQKSNIKELNIDFNSFKKFSQETSLKKIILYFIATRLNEKEINKIRDQYINIDDNLDGQISYEEFEKGFIDFEKKNSFLSNQNEIKQIFERIDINKNGKIDYTEFIAACLEGKKEVIEKRILDAFSSYDDKHTGKINKENFIKALHIDSLLNEKEFEDLINDLTKDNMIDYNEFLNKIN